MDILYTNEEDGQYQSVLRELDGQVWLTQLETTEINSKDYE